MLTKGKCERSEARQGYRSGHYKRKLTTTSGEVTLEILSRILDHGISVFKADHVGQFLYFLPHLAVAFLPQYCALALPFFRTAQPFGCYKPLKRL